MIRRMVEASIWAAIIGLVLFGWAIAARSAGRLDGSLTTPGLAVRYIGATLGLGIILGALAPHLRREWPARFFAALVGVVFAVLVGSLSGFELIWAGYVAVFAAPLFSLGLWREVQEMSKSLSGSQSGEADSNP